MIVHAATMSREDRVFHEERKTRNKGKKKHNRKISTRTKGASTQRGRGRRRREVYSILCNTVRRTHGVICLALAARPERHGRGWERHSCPLGRVRGKVKGSDGKGCHTCCCLLKFLSSDAFASLASCFAVAFARVGTACLLLRSTFADTLSLSLSFSYVTFTCFESRCRNLIFPRIS